MQSVMIIPRMVHWMMASVGLKKFFSAELIEQSYIVMLLKVDDEAMRNNKNNKVEMIEKETHPIYEIIIAMQLLRAQSIKETLSLRFSFSIQTYQRKSPIIPSKLSSQSIHNSLSNKRLPNRGPNEVRLLTWNYY